MTDDAGVEPSVESAVDSVAKRLLDNLLNIEVNTILKPGMTGRKMPVVGHALLDIFSEYDVFLADCARRMNRLWFDFCRGPGLNRYRAELSQQPERRSKSKVVPGNVPIPGLAAISLIPPDGAVRASEFKALRDRAQTALEMHRAMTAYGSAVPPADAELLKPTDENMLLRIMRNCVQLADVLENPRPGRTEPVALKRSADEGIAEGARPTEFSAQSVLTIRKVWELGTETILIQTVVQLDGDTVTRINDALQPANDLTLRDFHQQGVATAIGQWDKLVDTLVTIVDKLGTFLGGLLKS